MPINQSPSVIEPTPGVRFFQEKARFLVALHQRAAGKGPAARFVVFVDLHTHTGTDSLIPPRSQSVRVSC
jgi:hypothetical protein